MYERQANEIRNNGDFEGEEEEYKKQSNGHNKISANVNKFLTDHHGYSKYESMESVIILFVGILIGFLVTVIGGVYYIKANYKNYEYQQIL